MLVVFWEKKHGDFQKRAISNIYPLISNMNSLYLPPLSPTELDTPRFNGNRGGDTPHQPGGDVKNLTSCDSIQTHPGEGN